jgi:hypothetical protein
LWQHSKLPFFCHYIADNQNFSSLLVFSPTSYFQVVSENTNKGENTKGIRISMENFNSFQDISIIPLYAAGYFLKTS